MKPTTIDRVLDSHHRRVTPFGCWEWTGLFNNGGYGKVSVQSRTVSTHRYVYEQLRGKVPEGLELDHLCRNRKCMNPDHLETVTVAVNQQRGTMAKLNPALVAEMRDVARAEGPHPTAKRYATLVGVHWMVAYMAIKGKTWRNVPGALGGYK